MAHWWLQLVVVVHIVAENHVKHMVIVDTQNIVVTHIPEKIT